MESRASEARRRAQSADHGLSSAVRHRQLEQDRARLFSFITINWRGKLLRSYRTIVQLIGATITDTGLKVHAELDEKAQ